MKKILIGSILSIVLISISLLGIRFYNTQQKTLKPHAIDKVSTYKNTPVLNQEGSFALLSLSQLKNASVIVAKGKAISTVIKHFNTIPNVPKEDQKSIIYEKGSYEDTTFEISEFYKGSGSKTISIRQPANTPELGIVTDTPKINIGEDIVVYLFKGESIYAGGFLVQGKQGVARITTNSVLFANDKEYSMAEFLSSF